MELLLNSVITGEASDANKAEYLSLATNKKM